ncbi:MAG: RnfABCDGE type electron transport complex subunit D [Pleomorphochaeta sp.]
MRVKVSSSPHFHSKNSTMSIMWNVSLALAPAALWGVYVFGFRALMVLIVSILSSCLFEYLFGFFDGKKSLKDSSLYDGSAFLTGLLLGMNLSPTIPIAIIILANAFAIIVVKWTFGGLGANWMNPALAGRVFVFFSFTSAMSNYTVPRTLNVVDAIGSATPLSFVKTSLSAGSTGLSPSQILLNSSYPTTNIANSISSATGISPYAVDAFIGNVGGCIGEVSALLLIIGGIYLLVKKIITYHIPVYYILTFSLLTWVFGGLRDNLGMFNGEVLSQIFSGGLMLGAIFMATDMVTSPITKKGKIIYAIGCGFFTFLIRYFGSLPEAVSLAIILMNIVTPTIDRYIVPKKFGFVKKVKTQEAK